MSSLHLPQRLPILFLFCLLSILHLPHHHHQCTATSLSSSLSSSLSHTSPLNFLLSHLSSRRNRRHRRRRVIQNHPYFALTCIGLSGNCNRFYQKHSAHRCAPRTLYNRQSRDCYHYACTWCAEHRHRRRKMPCHHWRVREVCNRGGYYKDRNQHDGQRKQAMNKSQKKHYHHDRHNKKHHRNNKNEHHHHQKYQQKRRPRTQNNQHMAPQAEKATPSSSSGPPESKKKQCTWTGSDNRIVIGLSDVGLGTGWDRVTRGPKWRGIIFNRSPHRGISPPGVIGRMCFNVKAPSSGKYYLTAVSYAPHHTEHNDVWVETSKGFELWQHGEYLRFVQAGKWTKAYQNNGKKGISEMWKTIDFNGHRFIVPNVVGGQTFRVCIAGRSKKYEIFQILLIKCSGNKYCQGGIMKDMFYFKASKCVW